MPTNKKKFSIDYINRVIVLTLFCLALISLSFKLFSLALEGFTYKIGISYVAVVISVVLLLLGSIGLRTIFKHLKE